MNRSTDTNTPFHFCLNTSTIKGQNLPLVREIEVTAEAGYDGIEPWVREIDAYDAAGGSLAQLRRIVEKAGLRVVNLIGFFEWGVDDDGRRRAGMAEARRAMRMAAEIGCPMVAAPPMGLTEIPGQDLLVLAQRYAELTALGVEYGVVPVLEFWGMSKCLGRIGEAVMVAMESGRPEACVLADVFHMHKAGSNYESLKLAGPRTIGLVHMNDFPETPGIDAVTDADRVFPGDGVAPFGSIIPALLTAGYRGMLSLELFNREYWAMDAVAAAATGLAKMKQVVDAARAG